MAVANFIEEFVSDIPYFQVGDDVNIGVAWNASDGAPPGSMEWLQNVGSFSANGERVRTSYGLTWKDLFLIPAGSIVTAVQSLSFDEIFWATGGATARRIRLRVVTPAGVAVHSAGELQDLSGAINPVGGVTQNRGAGTLRSVDAAYQDASTPVEFEIQVNFTGTRTTSPDVEQDNPLWQITYTPPPAPPTSLFYDRVPMKAMH